MLLTIAAPVTATLIGFTTATPVTGQHVVNNILGENQTVVIEDLNVEGMMKNHNLANSIASCSWSEFFRILSYKSDWKGVNLIRIGRFEPSSKMCECGYVHRDLKLSDRIWTCPSCGAVNDRDLLAARNIKKFGLEKTNLIGQTKDISPVVNREGDVELLALAGAMKRQKCQLSLASHLSHQLICISGIFINYLTG